MICVVMPCYKSRDQVLDVIARIGPEVEAIVAVDDACPQGTGELIQTQCKDPRVEVLFNASNLGVGGACVAGFRRALELGVRYIVKLDSDGQMDPAYIPRLVRPLRDGTADYAKGNRFYDLSYLRLMPRVRLFGNAGLSFLSKASSGYWDLMDPTNGYLAIHRSALALLPLEKIDQRFFFESDLLFRLNIIKAVARDVPMPAVYADEDSSLSVTDSLFRFFYLHMNRLGKRVFYNYFLRDFNIGSVNLVLGSALLGWGSLQGVTTYMANLAQGQVTPTGTIMIVSLQIILGFQMLLSFINYDTGQIPNKPLQLALSDPEPGDTPAV